MTAKNSHTSILFAMLIISVLMITAFIVSCDVLNLSCFPDDITKQNSSTQILSLKLRTGAGGGGYELNSASILKGLNTITVYAALYDGNVYQSDVSVDWSATGSARGNITANLTTTSGVSTSFMALDTEEDVVITAAHAEYGIKSTAPITVENIIWLKESLSVWNYGTCGGSKAGGDWQVNGGQSFPYGAYALIKYAWPVVTGLPQSVSNATLYIYKADLPPNTAWTCKYAVYSMETSWTTSGTTWATRPDINQGLLQNFYNLSGTYTGWFSIDITGFYNSAWFLPNFYGFALYSDGSWPSDSFHTICGPAYTDPNLQPYIQILKSGQTVKFKFIEQ